MPQVCIIDVETTGKNQEAKAVQIGFALIGDMGKIVRREEHLINPKRPIEDGATRTHGLTDADVVGAPTLAKIRKRIPNADFYVAHNAGFDKRYLPAELAGKRWICTSACCALLWGFNYPNLECCFSAVTNGMPLAGAHHALDDVMMTYRVLEELLLDFSLEQLEETSNIPAFYEVLPIGKFAGKSIPAVIDYPKTGKCWSGLEWLLNMKDGYCDQIPGLSGSIRYWMSEGYWDAGSTGSQRQSFPSPAATSGPEE